MKSDLKQFNEESKKEWLKKNAKLARYTDVPKTQTLNRGTVFGFRHCMADCFCGMLLGNIPETRRGNIYHSSRGRRQLTSILRDIYHVQRPGAINLHIEGYLARAAAWGN